MAAQALVIFLRFGSLSSDERAWLTPKEVHLRTGIHMASQHNIVKRWRQRGFVVTKTKREGRKRTLTPEQIQWLISIDTLQSMSHLSLRRRALLIKEQLGLEKFDSETLRTYYLKHGVKYKRPDYRFWKSIAENKELREKQLEFVHKLGTLLIERPYDEILYVDETTVHVQMKVAKCWLTPGMKLAMIKERGPSITVIGAISEERGLVHSYITKENNDKTQFQHFLLGLKNKCKGRRVVVVLDNHPIHHARVLNDVYDSNFKELFLPPYSSVLNPIERLWSLFKRKWTQDLYRFSDELAQLPKKKYSVPRYTSMRL